MKRVYLLQLYHFYNVTFLKLSGCFREHKKIASILKCFPLVERLVLEEQTQEQNGGGDESLEFETNLPSLFLLQLRTVEVTWAKGNDSIFPSMQVLLKYASNLEKMVFKEK